jgi:hypothetical protein
MKEELTNQLDENGEEHGPWKHVHVRDDWWSEGSYHHGIEHGHWRRFFLREFIEAGRYHYGVKRGPWTEDQ